MNETYTKRLSFDVEPQDLLRLLRSHAKAKAGPFAWRLRSEGRELRLFLVVQKQDRDGFEGTVSTILYRKPGGSFLAEEGEPVATLHGVRVRQGESIVLMKCPEPRATGWIFVNFALGMEQLQQEVAKPTAEPAHLPVQIRIEGPGPGAARPQSASDTLPPGPRAVAPASDEEDLAAPAGRPGLDHDELVYRLAKAQEGEELKRKSPREPWKWIAREIGWKLGTDEPGLALLRDARLRLHRLKPDDPQLAEVAALRKVKEAKET